MAAEYAFPEEELAVDESLGFPKAYAKLCGDRSANQHSHGPPFTFTPYTLHPQEAKRPSDFDEAFPILYPKAKPTAKPKIFLGLLWKQLNHLGNAGFDPAVIRVDPYGNVLYYHADSASPLAWSIDHWFPCSRGGLTVPSNLRILQWQVCKKKHNKLEFLVPWWDLQLGVSINQFLCFFASSNSDFKHRAFSFLFYEGENEELNGSQKVESHSFPQHFVETKEKVGLAPAAIVVSQREAYDTSSSALKPLDKNRLRRPSSSIVACSKSIPSFSKENEDPDMVLNPYQAIVKARDSLKQREETLKMEVEIQKLDNEVNELTRKNEEDRVSIQDLELNLIKRRRRAEKCRRLAEAQNSYRTMLEKMIRDAMHQSVVYKEQVRLNQAATNALMARLEAQRAICDASEKELHKKFKLKDEIEKEIRPQWENTRKRFRLDDFASEDKEEMTVLHLPENKTSVVSHKELRVYLEEEQSKNKSENDPFLNEERKQEEKEGNEEAEEHNQSIVAVDDNVPIEDKLQELKIGEEKLQSMQFPLLEQPETEEDEENRKQRGKGNVEKWLHMLLENAQDGLDPYSRNPTANEISTTGESRNEPTLKEKYHCNKKEEIDAIEVGDISEGIGSRYSMEEKETREKSGKERKLTRSESARTFRMIPSSPSVILGMKKGVDCIGKKPTVTGDDDDDDGNEDHVLGNNFIKSSLKTIRKAVRI